MFFINIGHIIYRTNNPSIFLNKQKDIFILINTRGLFGIRRKINSVAGLQIIGMTRFLTFLVISIVFTKIGISREDIGLFEVSVFIASTVSFFWVSGIIQSFLTLYRKSETFGDNTSNLRRKSPEIFNTYIILIGISLLVFFIGLAIQDNFSVFGHKGKVPLLNATLFYILFASPANLVEYIYMIRNKSGNTLSYGITTFALQLFAVLGPLAMGYDIVYSLWGLVSIAILRNIWLFTLLYNYAEIKFSFPFIKEHLALAAPLILSTLISGSAQYIDGVVISTHYEADGFAIFRYGSKELPFVLMMASGLSFAMLTQFNSNEEITKTLEKIKNKSLRLMHYLYPLTILFLIFAKPLYVYAFNPEFTRSADVFVIYLLSIISRLLFPHTILTGMKKNKILFWASIFEFIINILLSLWLVENYGVVGVALATVIVYLLSKIFFVAYNYFKLGIPPSKYIPINWYVFYSLLLGVIFVLLDRKVFILF